MLLKSSETTWRFAFTLTLRYGLLILCILRVWLHATRFTTGVDGVWRYQGSLEILEMKRDMD